MSLETLLKERDGSVAIITLNRPEKMNALNSQLLGELAELLDQYENDSSVKVLVITGNGKAFCAGGDVNRDDKGDPLRTFLKFARLTRDTFYRIENFQKPVIAAINGYAFGGGLELALCCDMRIASEKAKMGLTETKLELSPEPVAQRLPRLIGLAMAKQLILPQALLAEQRLIGSAG